MQQSYLCPLWVWGIQAAFCACLWVALSRHCVWAPRIVVTHTHAVCVLECVFVLCIFLFTHRFFSRISYGILVLF